MSVPTPADEGPCCPQSLRADGKHGWHFDGDDPYIECSFCGEYRDALLAQQLADAREVADLLAETIEVMLEYPERATEVGRDSLVSYRHVRLDWALQP